MKLIAKSTDNQFLALEGSDTAILQVSDAAVVQSYPATTVVEWISLPEEVLQKSLCDLLVEKYNKFHAPAGTERGGRFMSRRQAQAAGLTAGENPDVPAGAIWVTPITTKGGTFANARTSNQTVPLNITKAHRDSLAEIGISTDRLTGNMQVAMETVDPDHLNGISEIRFVSDMPDGYGGSFDLNSRTITIDPTNTTTNATEQHELTMEHAIKHEIGHNVWIENLTPEQRVSFGYMTGYPNPEELGDLGWIDNPDGQSALIDRIMTTPVNSVTEYGRTNILDSWSEYYSKIDWRNRTYNSAGLSDHDKAVMDFIINWA
jgi:hypothetical protein